MDKFYVTSKNNSISNNVSLRKSDGNCRTSSEIFQTTSSSRRLGVGNICSKIRHKIEDNLTPKISAKLYKTGKHSKSLTALSSIGVSTGKYTLTNKNSTQAKATVAECRRINKSGSSNENLNPYAECYNVSKDKYFTNLSSANQLADSDEDEAQLSLNIANTSLEEEIFEELEKTSQDENKLKSVLKTFDKIILDYNDPGIAVNSLTDINENCVEMQASNTKNKNPRSVNKHDVEKASSAVNVNELLTLEQRKESCLEEQFVGPSASLRCNTIECNKLQKSVSTLSLTRRKCYQSPDSPCLRQMRNAFAQQRRSTSVWELSKLTKIPILKVIPLSTRSKSFSYSNFENSHRQEEFKLKNSSKTSSTLINDLLLKSDKILSVRNETYGSRENKSQESIQSNCTKPQSKTPLNNKSLQAKNIARESKNLKFVQKALTVQLPHNKTSDELLDKCLEKGQQILRKVESLKSHRTQISSYSRKAVTRTKSNSNNKICKENLANKRKQWLQKLNYANEEKIFAPSLESCKIIPPILGETSDKHAELLVQVTNAKQFIGNKKSVTSQESKTPSENELLMKHQESDSDDSGHISTENMDVSINHASHSSSSSSLCETSSASPSSATSPISDKRFGDCVENKSLKLSEVLKKFERKASLQPQTKSSKLNSKETSSLLPPPNANNTPDSRFCVTCRLAEVESVSLIRTHVEIYPNYTKEVTIRLH